MAEQKNETLHQKQTKNHPDLLESIDDCLTGDIKQTMLDFVEYCNEHKMRIQWGSTYQWYVYFRSKHIASIQLRFKGGRLGKSIIYQDNSCGISLMYLKAESPEFENFIRDNELSEVIWKNVKHCEGCLKTCVPREETILGKQFSNVAICRSIWFKNPDAEALECIKKLLDIRRTELGKNGVASGLYCR